jgi:radical SAM protein with 4Fe4S-binding SPASM domain
MLEFNYKDELRKYISSALDLYQKPKFTNKPNLRRLTIEINLTNDCNSKCSYCFEKGHFDKLYFSEDQIYLTCYKLEQLVKTDHFKQNYDVLNITFWGGEPTLNYPAIKFMLRYFLNFKNVEFTLYTNGIYLENIFENMIFYSKHMTAFGEPKLITQISYDGNPINEYNRICGDKVRENIINCMKYGVVHSIKSTIPLKSVNYVYESYCDIYDLQNSFPDAPHIMKGYCPTLERGQSVTALDKKSFRFALHNLELQIYKIMHFELDRWEKDRNVKPFFSWLLEKKQIGNCFAGKDLFTIDIDGFIYKCHGTLYTPNKKDHMISHIELDFYNDLMKSKMEHDKYESSTKLDDECVDCSPLYCVKCNKDKYDASNKENYYDKWYDFNVEQRVCILNRIISHKKNEFINIKKEYNNG